MKFSLPSLSLVLFLVPASLRAQIVLSIDVDERSVAPLTQSGFSSFVISSNTSATAVQTTPTTRTFGSVSVTVAGLGNPAYDDRVRATPTDAGALTQSAIYRDFVFQASSTNGDGLSVTLEGLTAAQFYAVTLWSFDATSTGNRVSDWTANGALVKSAYVFNGSVLPTTDAQYRFTFKIAADENGRILIQGRRNAATSSAGSVFINAMELEVTTPDAPSIAANPQPQTVYAGDHALFRAVPGGSPPLTLQWYQGDTAVEDATNITLLVLGATAGNAGDYSLVVSSPHGLSATSQVATLTVIPVVDVRSGLLAHWPLDDMPGDVAADVSGNMNPLAPVAMDVSNSEPGRHGTALRVNGIDEYLTRTNDFATLPAYQYSSYSVALWVKGNGVGQADRRVWSESSNTNNTPIVDIGTVPGGTNGAVDIFIRPNSGGGINHRVTSLIAFDGTWHHVAWVDNSGFGRVYVDGVLDTNNFTYTRGVLVADATCLGGVARTNGAIALFTGSLDDVHVWRRSLTGAEVRTVMERVRIVGFDPDVAVITYVTATPAEMHRVQETMDITGAWTDTTDVVIAPAGPNTFTATFPAPGADQKFYRVRSP